MIESEDLTTAVVVCILILVVYLALPGSVDGTGFWVN